MNTPRTDEEYAKTLNSLYEYVGAEYEAWHWARKLERELAELKLKIKDFCIEFDNTIWECNGDYGAQRLADSLAETIQDKFGNWTC